MWHEESSGNCEGRKLRAHISRGLKTGIVYEILIGADLHVGQCYQFLSGTAETLKFN